MIDATSVCPPEWLTLHDGKLRRGLSFGTWLVLLGATQQYRLDIRPAKGKFTCGVTQSNNGRRVDKGIEYADALAAANGGLEELRQALGW
jgi:hypothetical protein